MCLCQVKYGSVIEQKDWSQPLLLSLLYNEWIILALKVFFCLIAAAALIQAWFLVLFIMLTFFHFNKQITAKFSQNV